MVRWGMVEWGYGEVGVWWSMGMVRWGYGRVGIW